MVDFEYEYPERLELENGEEIVLTQDEMKNERTLAIVIPRSKAWSLASYLYEQGFSDANPAWFHGEKYGLSKIIEDPWEVHIRIFDTGYIYPHVEVRRDYFEHLDETYIWPIYEEIMKYVNVVTDAFGLLYLRTNQWVKTIVTKVKRVIPSPKSRTEWKPVVYAGIGFAVGIGIGYGLTKLFEHLDNEGKSN